MSRVENFDVKNLWKACASGDEQQVDLILQSQDDLAHDINHVNHEGNSVLMITAKNFNALNL